MAGIDLAAVRTSIDGAIRRACALGLVAIGSVALGPSWSSALPARMAALGTTLMMLVLLLKTLRLETLRPAPQAAGSVAIGQRLRERLPWHATAAGWVALALWLAAIAAAR